MDSVNKNNISPATPAIRVQGLAKYFGSHLVLNGVNFEVSQGESVVIFGPNGAGKTTLIKILATIMNPSSGKVVIDGLSPKRDAENIRRRIGVITHQTFLYNALTAYENLMFYSRLYDVPCPGERIEEIAAKVALTSRLHDHVGTLSRGLQQRLAIARSLLHEPSILLLDEPETGLDQQATSILREAILAEDGVKRTIILTTHNLERGLELSSRLLILSKGKIVYEGVTKAIDLANLKEAYQQSTGVKM